MSWTGVAVGRVTATTARVWARSSHGGVHRLQVRSEDGASTDHVVDAGDTRAADGCFAHDVGGLRPLTRYHVSLDGVGEARFETAPSSAAQMPKRFAFGIASCHQPSEVDGTVRERAPRMLSAAQQVWTEHDAKFVLWMGDQIYADWPPERSMLDRAYFATVAPPGRRGLLECTEAEVRRLYQQRYREAWALPEWRALHARFPGYPMLDDHEVADNFGSLPEHHAPGFSPIRAGALSAYRDYQHSRVSSQAEPPFDYAFDYGSVGVCVLDLRTQRTATRDRHARILSPQQLDRLRAWLDERVSAPALFVVLTVPLFFIPGWADWLAARLPTSYRGSAHDRWLHRGYKRNRRDLLQLLRTHHRRNPKQKLVLLSGDVHVGYAMQCTWRAEPRTDLYQFVSSPITNEVAKSSWRWIRHVPRSHVAMPGVGGGLARIHLMGSLKDKLKEPFARLNVGVVEVDTSEEEAAVRFQLWGEADAQAGTPELLMDVTTRPP